MLTCRIQAEHQPNDLLGAMISFTDESGTLFAAALASLQELGRLEEDLSWYFERHKEMPRQAAEALGKRVREGIGCFGEGLFKLLFDADEEARAIWHRLAPRLGETRIEIVESAAASGIPWEWLRDPSDGSWLAQSCAEFVRASPAVAARKAQAVRGADALRILLVISRPYRGSDVPFRPVANAMWSALSTDDEIGIEFFVLRPPTFEQLQAELDRAQRAGTPYDVVHFDGHGVHQDLFAEPGGGGKPRGYAIFEGPPAVLASPVYIEGRALGEALVRGGVRHLILNACRSGYAALKQDSAAGTSTGEGMGSIAQEALNAGLEGVIAMKYEVDVPTASQLVTAIYDGVGRGLTCGETVSRARRALFDPAEPDSLAWARWLVPVAFAQPQLAPVSSALDRLDPPQGSAPVSAAGETATAPRRIEPLASPGVAGRDETLLELDRLFDLNCLVLLHGPPGQGKTLVASEFSRWYYLTGGIMAPVIFTRIGKCTSFQEALDDIGRAYEPVCARHGFDWFAQPEDSKRTAALQLLSVDTGLWVLDGVERVCGIGNNDPSAWPGEDREKLLQFLQQVCATKCRMLVTSCRDEQAWLGPLPGRIPLRALTEDDRTQLLILLALQHRQKSLDLEDWKSLLERTAGHPATLIALGRAVYANEGHRRPAAAGAARALDPGASVEPDLRSQVMALCEPLFDHLRKSLSGVAAAPDALLLFAHCVGCIDLELLDLISLQAAGVTEEELLERLYVQRERSATSRPIFDALAAGGLVEPSLTGDFGFPHPLLPLALERLALDGRSPADAGNLCAEAESRFVQGLTTHLNVYDNFSHSEGAMTRLRAHRPNARHALDLAIRRNWIDEAMTLLMAAGRSLERDARWDQWDELLSLVAPLVPEPASEEDEVALDRWRFVADARVTIDRARGDIEAATAVQTRLAQLLALAAERPAGPDKWEQQQALSNAAQAWIKLGQVLAQGGSLSDAAVGDAFRTALTLARRSEVTATVAESLTNLAQHLGASDDPSRLQEAQALLRESLDCRADSDRRGRGMCYGLLARCLYHEAEASPVDAREQLRLDAAKNVERAIRIFPRDDPRGEGNLHYEAQRIYLALGQEKPALTHLMLAIERFDDAADWSGGSTARLAAAAQLYSAHRLAEAVALVRSVIQIANRVGPAAQGFRRNAEQLLRLIVERAQSAAAS